MYPLQARACFPGHSPLDTSPGAAEQCYLACLRLWRFLRAPEAPPARPPGPSRGSWELLLRPPACRAVRLGDGSLSLRRQLCESAPSRLAGRLGPGRRRALDIRGGSTCGASNECIAATAASAHARKRRPASRRDSAGSSAVVDCHTRTSAAVLLVNTAHAAAAALR
jgi:hypothetical protein